MKNLPDIWESSESRPTKGRQYRGYSMIRQCFLLLSVLSWNSRPNDPCQLATTRASQMDRLRKVIFGRWRPSNQLVSPHSPAEQAPGCVYKQCSPFLSVYYISLSLSPVAAYGCRKLFPIFPCFCDCAVSRHLQVSQKQNYSTFLCGLLMSEPVRSTDSLKVHWNSGTALQTTSVPKHVWPSGPRNKQMPAFQTRAVPWGFNLWQGQLISATSILLCSPASDLSGRCLSGLGRSGCSNVAVVICRILL